MYCFIQSCVIAAPMVCTAAIPGSAVGGAASSPCVLRFCDHLVDLRISGFGRSLDLKAKNAVYHI